MQHSSAATHRGPVLPEKDADVNWRHSENSVKTYLSALVDGQDVMVSEEPQSPVGESPYVPVLLNPAGREHWLYLKKRRNEFLGAEKKGTSALIMFCGTNLTAQSVLRNFMRQAEVAEANANAAAILLDPAHVPPPARTPRVRDQLQALAAHYDPQSELLSIVRMEEAKRIVFRDHESVASFMVRLDDALNHADMVRPTPIPLFERRQMLDTALANSRDQSLQNLTTHLQMAPQGGTWEELKSAVLRFDLTTAGMKRLIKTAVVNSIEGGDRGKRKREAHPMCTECDKRHGGTDCWEKHPELKPDWFKKKEVDGLKKKNKPHPHFTFGDPKPGDTSMLTAWEDEEEDEVSFLMRDGQPGILMDTGASNRLFLLTDKTPIERYETSDRIIGTAHSQGKLKVDGTGWIGQQEVAHCSHLRRPIISHGRIRSWGCTIALPTEGGPELHKGSGRLLRGIYVKDMPVFSLEEILQVAREQPEERMVMAITRSETERIA
jgi:hypothetical protein